MGNSQRDNTSLTIQASAASADVTTPWVKNQGYLGGIFTFDITAQSATDAQPTFTVQGRIGNTTKAYNIARVASTAAPAATARIIVMPSASTVLSTGSTSTLTNPVEIVRQALPFQFRVKSTNIGTGTVTWAGFVDLIG